MTDRALLLAAGLGTRLRPITDHIPKCLVPVCGKPLLAHWLDLLSRHGVRDVLVNTHHLPDQVETFVSGYRGPVRVHLVFEPELLGSAGTIHANRGFTEGREQFFILYADNLTNVDLTALARYNSERPSPLTVGLFRAENPRACGIAILDERGTITEFAEKPEHPRGDLASAGVFVARQELFGYIAPRHVPSDFGTDVMPGLQGVMNGMLLDGYLRDIGTHESLEMAGREFPGTQNHQ